MPSVKSARAEESSQAIGDSKGVSPRFFFGCENMGDLGDELVDDLEDFMMFLG